MVEPGAVNLGFHGLLIRRKDFQISDFQRIGASGYVKGLRGFSWNRSDECNFATEPPNSLLSGPGTSSQTANGD